MAKIESTGGHIKIMLDIEMAKIEINRRPYWIYFIYIDYQNENRIMLIIEMAKMEFTGGHIEIMLFIEITKIKLTGSHIVIMLIIEMAKKKLELC